MAMAKKKARKATKATSKPQKATKRTKVSKVRAKAKTAQDATGTAASGFQNPYRAGGSYAAIVNALASLGIGRMHDRDSILNAVRDDMGHEWSVFAKKENRSDKTGKDAEGRAWQNCAVLARPQYGAKLREAGYEIRFRGRDGLCGLFEVGSK